MADHSTGIIIPCVIADDEPIARQGMQKLVEQVPFLQLAGTAKDVWEIDRLLSQTPVQLLLLDIQMPGINGVDYVKSLTHPPKVIFTTAWPEYAIEGYNLDVLDYLLKPITLGRFLKAVNKAIPNATTDNYLFVKANRQLQKVSFEEILFIEAMLNYVVIYTTTGKIITYASVKSMLESLPASLFVRIHKSYIIATAKIKSLQGNEVTIGSHTLPISRTHKEALLKAISRK